jgi:lysozyme family protein
MSFAACLPIILQSEGGFVNDPHDPGGATNLGITLATLCSWLGRAATIAEVQALTPAAVSPIYLARYYNPSHADGCPAGVDLMVFDEAVNQGVGRAITARQACVGVAVDGRFGPATRAAVAAAHPPTLIDAIAVNRDAHYRALPGFARYGAGWLARVARTQRDALAMAGAG